MSLRTRPVLDRKHRPRWQDELRTQQLVVAAFAVAIAVALGIFGATAWNAYWEAHLRPVAAVGNETFTRGDLAVRERALAAEIQGTIVDLQGQLGGSRDTIIQQQISSLTTVLSSLTGRATDSLVQAATLRARAGDLGISVTDDDVDAEVAERSRVPERVRLQLILVEPEVAEDAQDDEPTDEDREAARARADEIHQRVAVDGEDFATVAGAESDDFTAAQGGVLGWIAADDPAYAEYVEAAADVAVDEIVGPVEVERGYAILRVIDRRPEGPNESLSGALAANGVSADEYRAYVRDSLVLERFRTHFEEEVATSPQPQRRVAQIFIGEQTGTPVPEQRARHILVQPLPGEQDQSAATDEQWEAALEVAEQVREELQAPDADWLALAEEHSQDPGSRTRGGDLGWFPAEDPPFVEEFNAALEDLEVLGDVSEPVRSQFGYHLVQLTGERLSAAAVLADVHAALDEDPDRFAELAEQYSDDTATAADGGEVGWVARYQLPEELEHVVFELPEEGAISEPVPITGDGTYILRLLEISESREIEEERLTQIRSAGFDRWLESETEGVPVWTDPLFAVGTAA